MRAKSENHHPLMARNRRDRRFELLTSSERGDYQQPEDTLKVDTASIIDSLERVNSSWNEIEKGKKDLDDGRWRNQLAPSSDQQKPNSGSHKYPLFQLTIAISLPPRSNRLRCVSLVRSTKAHFPKITAYQALKHLAMAHTRPLQHAHTSSLR